VGALLKEIRMNDLEARVRRLERSNRFWMILCAALIGAPWIAGAAAQDRPKPPQLPPGAKPPAADVLPPSAKQFFSDEIQKMIAAEKQVHNVLRARALVLVDRADRVKAILSTDEKGHPALSMFGVRDGGRQEALSLMLGVESNKPQCVLYDPSERPKVGLYGVSPTSRGGRGELLFAGGGQVVINHENGNNLARFESSKDGSTLQFNSNEGKEAAKLSSYLIGNSSGQLFRKTELTMTCSDKPNTASMFALPTVAGFNVHAGGTRYGASMTAETFGIIRARCGEPFSGKDLRFTSKWEYRDGRELNFLLVDKDKD
jgi:hypothetical protein